MITNNEYKGLAFEPTSEAIDTAKARIAEERSGEQLGLYCRWDGINHLMGKYWRFRHVTMICGMSGSGKSYFLNMLRQDFLDNVDVVYQNLNAFNLHEEPQQVYFDPNTKLTAYPTEGYPANALYYPKARLVRYNDVLVHKAINRDCKHQVICIHFGYEMDAADELLRAAGNRLSKSFGYLMSSEWNRKLEAYARLTDIEAASCEEVLESFRNRLELYIPTSGNMRQMYWTVERIQNMYPNAKLTISLDHTLLSKKLNEKSDMELQANIALTGIDIRQDFNAMFIPLVQLNQNIEADDRILKPVMHYPGKKDIHLGGQAWWACDNVFINHRPKVLNIKQYGPDKLDTTNLLHAGCVKSRKGTLGNVFLYEDFDNGRILDATKSDFEIDSKPIHKSLNKNIF